MTVRISASQSFSEPEVRALEQLLTTLLRGADPGVVLRSESIRNVHRKVLRMRKRIDDQHAKKLSPEDTV